MQYLATLLPIQLKTEFVEIRDDITMRIVISSLLAILVLLVVTPHFAFASDERWYAFSNMDASNITGFRADIETADPHIDTGHSLATIWLRTPQQNRWMEIGWLKGSGDPTQYSYCSPASQCEPIVESGYEWYDTVSNGSSHNYRIKHISENQWKLYINNRLKRTITDFGASSSNNIQVGGEVTDDDNDIGVSGLLNVRYERNNDGDWWPFDGDETADDGYWIIEIAGSDHNMQIGTCHHEPAYC